MGWGDIAKEALSHSVGALQAIQEVKAMVNQILVATQQYEQRQQMKVDMLEARIRELEREVARLNGAVSGTFSEAMKAVLLSPRTSLRSSEPDIGHKAVAASEGDSLPVGED